MALKILLIDDSAVMRKVLGRALRQAAIDIGEVLEAGDGFDALAVLESDDRIEMILCDWNISNMGGLEFVAAARAKGHAMPIVMVTTEGGRERIQQATSAGANGLVTKPFTPEKLAETLAPLTTRV